MRAAITLLLFLFTLAASAREWKSTLFRCTANLPDGNGWQTIELPPMSGLTPLVVVQNTGRNSVFGINVVDDPPGNSLAEPAVRTAIETTMRKFGYEWVGHSSMQEGGLDWVQYPVRAGSGTQQVSGLIRFTSAGGYIFGVTMLKGGASTAPPDTELRMAAASFRILPAPAVTAAAKPADPAPPAADSTTNVSPTPDAASAQTSTDPDARRRLIWYGGGGLLALLFFFGIIARGKNEQR